MLSKGASKVVDKAGDIMSAPYRAFQSVRGRVAEKKAASSFIDQLPGGGVMGQKNLGTAASRINDMTKKGNMAGARAYVKEQNTKMGYKSK